jgi:hypothetical protein
MRPRLKLPSGNDFYDLQAVPVLNLHTGKLRRANGIAIEFDDHTAWKKILRHEELFKRTRQFGLDFATVGNDLFWGTPHKSKTLHGVRLLA